MPFDNQTIIGRLKQEPLRVAWIALGLFLILATFSFHPNDHSAFTSGDGSATRNLAGSVGAWLSSWLLYSFGYVAFLIPLSALWLGLRPIRAHDAAWQIPILIRAAAWLATLLTLSALAAQFLGAPETWVPQGDVEFEGGGGIAGLLLSKALMSLMGQVCATSMLLVVLIGAVSLAFLVRLEIIGKAITDLVPHSIVRLPWTTKKPLPNLAAAMPSPEKQSEFTGLSEDHGSASVSVTNIENAAFVPSPQSKLRSADFKGRKHMPQEAPPTQRRVSGRNILGVLMMLIVVVCRRGTKTDPGCGGESDPPGWAESLVQICG